VILDTSALCAVLFGEPEASALLEFLSNGERKLLSAVNAFEASLVVEARLGLEGSKLLAELLQTINADVVAFDASLAEVAHDAWRRFGKGRHAAGLNFADCAAYALAKVTNQPLLFKGDDFTHTDVVAVFDHSPR
jgi:ribonuclease VapC